MSTRVSTRAALAIPLILAGCLFALPAARAEEPTEAAKDAIEAARKAGAKIKINPRTGMPSSVTGIAEPDNRSGARSLSATAGKEPTEAELKSAFEAHFRRGSLSAAYAPSNPDAKIVSTSKVVKDRDVPGQYITEGEQRVKDIPVFASKARAVMSKSRSVLSASTNLSRVAIDSVEPRLDAAAATAAARKKLAEIVAKPSAAPQIGRKLDADKASANATLQIFDPALIASRGQIAGPTRLAWMVSIETFRIFVDAKTGEVFYYYRDHPSARLVRRIYDLAERTDFPASRVVIDEEKSVRNEPVPADADTAFEYSQYVDEFFEKVLGRKGFDDSTLKPAASAKSTTQVESYVRVGDMPNAYWCTHETDFCPKADVMIYGPGFAGALDIVAHEMTHGIISYEADLLYADEPGAVNEAFADIFGSLIELRTRGDKGNWKIAENLPGFESVPMRDLANPHLAGADGAPLFSKEKDFDQNNRGQPEHWDEFVRRVDPMCTSLLAEDNGCVHINSGIVNKMAQLIADGGTHRGVTVTGIGRDKLARIAYRTLTTHLNKGSGIVDTASAFSESCEELANNKLGDVVSSDCTQVQNAVRAVGLNVEG